MTNEYGPHLTLDLSECQAGHLLDDLSFIFELLTQLPQRIGMHKITEPYVVRCAGAQPGDEGITGVVLIMESHIAIHTYTAKRFAFVDVFSCRPFAERQVVEYFNQTFLPQQISTQRLARGQLFHR